MNPVSARSRKTPLHVSGTAGHTRILPAYDCSSISVVVAAFTPEESKYGQSTSPPAQ